MRAEDFSNVRKHDMQWNKKKQINNTKYSRKNNAKLNTAILKAAFTAYKPTRNIIMYFAYGTFSNAL
jgi:hypothetical protein